MQLNRHTQQLVPQCRHVICAILAYILVHTAIIIITTARVDTTIFSREYDSLTFQRRVRYAENSLPGSQHTLTEISGFPLRAHYRTQTLPGHIYIDQPMVYMYWKPRSLSEGIHVPFLKTINQNIEYPCVIPTLIQYDQFLVNILLWLIAFSIIPKFYWYLHGIVRHKPS
jgi:hypothetical protein